MNLYNKENESGGDVSGAKSSKGGQESPEMEGSVVKADNKSSFYKTNNQQNKEITSPSRNTWNHNSTSNRGSPTSKQTKTINDTSEGQNQTLTQENDSPIQRVDIAQFNENLVQKVTQPFPKLENLTTSMEEMKAEPSSAKLSTPSQLQNNPEFSQQNKILSTINEKDSTPLNSKKTKTKTKKNSASEMHSDYAQALLQGSFISQFRTKNRISIDLNHIMHQKIKRAVSPNRKLSKSFNEKSFTDLKNTALEKKIIKTKKKSIIQNGSYNRSEMGHRLSKISGGQNQLEGISDLNSVEIDEETGLGKVVSVKVDSNEADSMNMAAPSSTFMRLKRMSLAVRASDRPVCVDKGMLTDDLYHLPADRVSLGVQVDGLGEDGGLLVQRICKECRRIKIDRSFTDSLKKEAQELSKSKKSESRKEEGKTDSKGEKSKDTHSGSSVMAAYQRASEKSSPGLFLKKILVESIKEKKMLEKRLIFLAKRIGDLKSCLSIKSINLDRYKREVDLLVKEHLTSSKDFNSKHSRDEAFRGIQEPWETSSKTPKAEPKRLRRSSTPAPKQEDTQTQRESERIRINNLYREEQNNNNKNNKSIQIGQQQNLPKLRVKKLSSIAKHRNNTFNGFYNGLRTKVSNKLKNGAKVRAKNNNSGTKRRRVVRHTASTNNVMDLSQQNFRKGRVHKTLPSTVNIEGRDTTFVLGYNGKELVLSKLKFQHKNKLRMSSEENSGRAALTKKTLDTDPDSKDEGNNMRRYKRKRDRHEFGRYQGHSYKLGSASVDARGSSTSFYQPYRQKYGLANLKSAAYSSSLGRKGDSGGRSGRSGRRPEESARMNQSLEDVVRGRGAGFKEYRRMRTGPEFVLFANNVNISK